MGKKILQTYEMYEYKVTRCDPETCEGGLFAGHIDRFLKLKAEANRYHDWVRNPADEVRYIDSFWRSEGIRLDKVNKDKRG